MVLSISLSVMLLIKFWIFQKPFVSSKIILKIGINIFFLLCLADFNELSGFSSPYALSSLKNRGCNYMVRMTKFNELLILLPKENILPV